MMLSTDINIRDPFVLVHDGKYYLYGTRGAECWGDKATGLDCYVSTDLEHFEGPFEVFTPPEGFWATRNFWAPEVHEYKGAFYMFASFKADGVSRGTQILKADTPLGPFRVHSDGPVTPADWECLDGTFYVEPTEGGRPYMIFCHEWVQVENGEMCAIALSDDLTHAVGEPELLFKATEAPWIVPMRDNCYVTDGPFVYRAESGEITLLWSSFGKGGYTMALAKSASNTVHGPWNQIETPLFDKDGGHGMIFKDLNGKLMVALHTPNDTPNERPAFFEIKQDL